MQFTYVSTLLDMPHIALAMGVPAVSICHSVTQSCCFATATYAGQLALTPARGWDGVGLPVTTSQREWSMR